MAWPVTGGQAWQCSADLHVEVFFRDDLVNKVISPSSGEHSVGRRERHKTFLGHTASRSHEQLFSHTHLEVTLREIPSKDMQVSVLGQVSRHTNDTGVLLRSGDQGMPERSSFGALPLTGDGGDHGRGGQAWFFVSVGAHFRSPPSHSWHQARSARLATRLGQRG